MLRLIVIVIVIVVIFVVVAIDEIWLSFWFMFGCVVFRFGLSIAVNDNLFAAIAYPAIMLAGSCTLADHDANATVRQNFPIYIRLVNISF